MVKFLEKMKLIFFVLFGTGLSFATINTNNTRFSNAPMDECDLIEETTKKPILYYPKKVCNIDKSSINDAEKLSIFITECVRTKNDWLLIDSSDANYIDEILY